MGDALQLNWDSLQILLSLCIEFKNHTGKFKTEELRRYAIQIGKAFGIDDIDKYAVNKVKSSVNDELSKVMDPESSKRVAAIAAKACKPVMMLAVKFARGGMAPQDFMLELNKICFGNVGELESALQQALGIPDETSKLLAEQFGPYLVSIYCFAAAYKIYQGAARDAELARQHRIEVERLVNESVAELKARRAEMEELVSTYMLARLPVFEESVIAMDQAILDNDDDGFIKANAGLWELFGRNAQYQTAEEFDDLMLSDEAFIL